MILAKGQPENDKNDTIAIISILMKRKCVMKYRLTPLFWAIILAFQPHLARADGVVDKQLLKATGAKIAIEAADYVVQELTQPQTQSQKNHKQNKNQSKKNTHTEAEPLHAKQAILSPLAHQITELNAAQIDAKLNDLSANNPISGSLNPRETASDNQEDNVAPQKTQKQSQNKKSKNKTQNPDSGSLKTENKTETETTDSVNSVNLTDSEPEQTQTQKSPAPKKAKWQFWKRDTEENTNEQTESDGEQEKELIPKYPIEIQTDSEEISKLLEQHLPIISYQKREEMDDEQISYLVEDTPKDVQNLVRTEGYFNAQTQITPKPDVKGYRVSVDLGQRTTIDNVNVAIVGDILQDKQLGAYYKQAFTGWKLPVGATFRQEDWGASKVSVLSAITRQKYPLAKLTQTQATINPNTHKADLDVMVQSNQAIYFGEMDISGHRRYPKSVISGLADFKVGDPYDLDKLLDYQQALENDSHYSGASVQADFDAMVGNRVPVKVQVSEVKRQKIEAGLRFDSEYGLGGRLGYDHYNLFNRGYVGSVSVEADKYQTSTGIGISQPRDARGRFWTSNFTYNRSTTQNLERRAISTGIWHVLDRNDTEWRFGLEFLGEDSRVPDTGVALGKSFATMLTAQWKKHNLETQMRPKNGYYADVKLGSTLGKLASSAMMARANANAMYYFTPENEALGTVLLRGAMGYVYTNQDEAYGQVPTSLMFRTGGGNTIRGYELDSIGRRMPNSSTVFPDRAMASASFEYQYPLPKKLMGQEFAVAAFHDVGGVARTFQTIQWKHGSGLGLRWFSPVAPFSFDVAYGHQDKKIRWHIGLGTRF